MTILVVAAISQSNHANPETPFPREKAPPAKRGRGLGDENDVMQVARFFWTFRRQRTIRENANYF